jgi:hypothetical protein
VTEDHEGPLPRCRDSEGSVRDGHIVVVEPGQGYIAPF